MLSVTAAENPTATNITLISRSFFRLMKQTFVTEKSQPARTQKLHDQKNVPIYQTSVTPTREMVGLNLQ